MLKKTVWILSLTPVTDEPRVRRQAQACLNKGWQVVVVGFPGRAKNTEDWNLITFAMDKTGISSVTDSREPILEEGSPTVHAISEDRRSSEVSVKHRLIKAVKRIIHSFPKFLRDPLEAFGVFVLDLPAYSRRMVSGLNDAAAREYYFKNTSYRFLYDFMMGRIRAFPHFHPDLIVGNDYFCAPVCEALSRECGCQFSIDIHEYARGQYMHKLFWRILERPWVNRIQKIYFPKAAVNTTVCDGIADLLVKDYHSLSRPLVVWSVPTYVPMEFRRTGERIKVLYHGIVCETRGLDLAIESLVLWRPEFDLVIRGPGAVEYFDHLKEKAQELGVSGRVFFEQPVLFHEIIPSANQCDIGYFVHKDISPQKRFTLPNKFFEYVMAGVALCVSDLPEMARIVKKYDLGCMVKDYSAEEVASVINGYTRERIDFYKKNSLLAAKELCWENESMDLSHAYEQAMSANEMAVRR